MIIIVNERKIGVSFENKEETLPKGRAHLHRGIERGQRLKERREIESAINHHTICCDADGLSCLRRDENVLAVVAGFKMADIDSTNVGG